MVKNCRTKRANVPTCRDLADCASHVPAPSARQLSQKADETNARIFTRLAANGLGDTPSSAFPVFATPGRAVFYLSVAQESERMMKAETKKLFIRLKELTTEGNKNIYERVKTASAIMQDTDWIAEQHNGDEDAAAEAVQNEYFASLGAWVPLLKLCKVYEMFPTEKQWAEYRYNLPAMVGLYDAQRDREPREQRTVNRAKLSDIERLEDDKKALEYRLKQDQELLAARAAEIAELRVLVRKLEEENAVLRGKLSILSEQRAA